MMLPAGTVDSAPLVRTPICSQTDEGDRQPDEVAAAVGPRAVVQHGFGGGYRGQGQRALPGVAKKAGVQAIVSKWELNYQGPNAEVVDVTEDLAVLFHASDNGQK